MSFPENRAMTPLTGLSVVMADETTPLVHLRQEAYSSNHFVSKALALTFTESLVKNMSSATVENLEISW